MSIETGTVTLPAYWASALINGDYTGLSDDEQNQLTECVEDLLPWQVVDVARDEDGNPQESRFTRSYRLYNPYADCSGGDVLDYVVHRI